MHAALCVMLYAAIDQTRVHTSENRRTDDFMSNVGFVALRRASKKLTQFSV